MRRTLMSLLLIVAAAAPASAQTGVVVDPDSPPGKEYAIPLESVREGAAPSGPQSDGAATKAPLFGVGVGDDEPVVRADSSPQPDGGGTTQRATRRPGSATGAGDGSAAAEGSESQSVRGGRPVAAAVPEGGTGSTLTIAAVALSVLLLGGVIGSIARRRSG